MARAEGMNRKRVKTYFCLLQNILEKNELFDKPGHIYNMDETGVQLNNKPGYVIAQKGSKCVQSVTSTEKGETITVIACCNAEGNFIPPTCIFKGKYEKDEYRDGMPPGSNIYMCEKSAYVNSEIFIKWLKEQFVPRKPVGRVLLILDGHTSHTNNIENNIVGICRTRRHYFIMSAKSHNTFSTIFGSSVLQIIQKSLQ